MPLIEKIEPVAFVLFVASLVWFFWVPQRYLLANLKNQDFDFYRDLSFYLAILKNKRRMVIGKLVIIYIVSKGSYNPLIFDIL